MKTTWIVVGLLVLVLLAVAIREGFDTYEDALKDVGQSSETVPSTVPYTNLPRPTMGMDKLRQDIAVYTGLPRSDSEAANAYMKQLQAFYDTIYLPDKKEPSQSDFSGFAESVDLETVPERLRSNFRSSLVSILDSYFSPPGTGPSPSSSASGTEAEAATGETGTTGQQEEEAVPGSAAEGAVTGSTTGGTSGTTYGPTSAPKGGRNVWGPLFKGTGEGVGPVGGDSTKSNAYPALMGGMGGRSGTLLEGVGVVAPSGVGLDSGAMPSSSSLGTDANARFLPYSRQPGDMDLVPDPYRLAKNFSSSSYSASKTDPVPFLTDFSAFYR